MQDFICVTSMSKTYYDFIGKFMLESWTKYWPSTLIVYSEDDLSFLNSNKITYKDWNKPCLESWNRFCSTNVHESEKKFAKKGFASLESWKSIKAKKIIWLDADMIFKKEIDSTVLDKILSDNKLLVLFTHNYCPERYEGLSSESGFYIVNTQHTKFNDFIYEYERIYNLETTPKEISGRGDHKILALVANKFFFDVEDLSNYRTKDKTTTPLNHCFLSEYMSHFKGKSKKNKTQIEFETFTNKD